MHPSSKSAAWVFTLTLAVSILIACAGQNVTPSSSAEKPLRHDSKRSAWATYPLGYTAAFEISAVRGPNNSVWLADYTQNVITEISTTGQTETYGAGNFVLPEPSQTPATPPADPEDVEAGPNNNIYYLASYGYGIMTASGSPTLYALGCLHISCSPEFVAPTSSTIAVTPDGSAWTSGASDPYGSAAYVVRAQGGNETLIPVSIGSRYANPPKFLALGPDGNVWYTNYSAFIGRVNVNNNSVATYPIPSPYGSSGFPGALTAGPDGNLWISHCNTPYSVLYSTARGVVSGFGVPPQVGNLCVQGEHEIFAGPNQDIYFMNGGYFITRLNVKNRQFSAYNLVPTPKSGYGGVQTGTLGADGNIWVFMDTYPDVYVFTAKDIIKTSPVKVRLQENQSTTITVKEVGFSKNYLAPTYNSCVVVTPSESSGAFTITAGNARESCYISFTDEDKNDTVYVPVTVTR
ncbi:MAG TPA: hypothetical protein VFE16_05425 [Candidatus Cybelea sp.]|jgi:streptogramin lyase|nr:hypothetical protein [Candidatus Cybelea sp.]